MKLVLNGEVAEIDAATTVADIVRERAGAPSGRGIAVALNGEVVPRAEWESTSVRDGDRVEVLSAAQGG